MPPSAALKRPSRRLTAPVKAPRSWPNSSASSSVSGNAAQLTAMNGFARARAALVQRARDQLLAGAALAGDQHGRVALRDGVDAVEQPQHRRAAPDDRPRAVRARLALRQLGARLLQLALERALRADALHLQDDLVDVERLGEVVVRAFLERGDRVGDRGVRGDQDDVGARRLLAHAPEQRQAVDLRAGGCRTS